MLDDKYLELLESRVDYYNRPSFIESDPIFVPHQFTKLQDIEIAALMAAIFAWGQRKTIINKTIDFLARMDNTPHDFILNHTEKDTAIKLLEMQRHSMLMYASCGWFFNDISGIETEQILLYAGRVIQFAEELSGDSLEPDFVKLLELAVSNLKGKAN